MDQNSHYFGQTGNTLMASPPFLPMANVVIKTEPQVFIKTEPQDTCQSMVSCSEDTKPVVSKGKKKRKPKQEKITDHMPVKKKRDRFNGMSEDEVMKRLLPDHLTEDLDIVIVGINPGLMAAYVGHHYAGPGNHFWKCMYLSGLIPEPLTAYDDYKLLKYGIGFTNIVNRTTRGSADLSRKEIKQGAQELTEKLQKFKPKIAVFNGKGIYEVFCGNKNFSIGKQPEPLSGTDTVVYVMPSSSARCSQLPRAVDKVPFYAALKKLRDYHRGDLKELDDSEVCFPDLELKVVKKEVKQEENVQDPSFPQMVPGNMQMPFNNGQSNESLQHLQQTVGLSQGQFMNIKQEIPFNPQDYGSVMPNNNTFNQQVTGSITTLPCSSSNFQAVTTATFVSGVNSHPNSQGPPSSYQSQVMFQGQIITSQESQPFSSSQGNYHIPQGQFASPQGQPIFQGQQHGFSTQSPPQQFRTGGNMQGWTHQIMSQQQQQQPSQNPMPNQVYIKPEPQDYSSTSTCPFSSVG